MSDENKHDRFIKAVQTQLKSEGLYDGAIDGDPGTLTWRAWNEHEAKHYKHPEPAPEPDDSLELPICSVEHDGIYPVAEDRVEGENHYRTTDGFLWSRDGKIDPETGERRKYHPAQDITERMPKSEPIGINSDGTFGTPKGSRVLACLPGVVVAINRKGSVWSITLKHNTEEFGICYSNYRHINGEAPGITEGMLVAAGRWIAYNGYTGTRLRHLHFQFCQASKSPRTWRKNDYSWLQTTAINLGGKDWDHYKDGWLNAWPRVFMAID